MHAFEGGEYTFTVTTDGGVRVYIDGNSVIDKWSAADTPAVYSGSSFMEEGFHSIKVEYFNKSVDAAISLSWELGDNNHYALSLDGSDDYAALPADTWFNGDFTIEAWVYINSYNSWSRLIDFANGPASDNVLVALSNETSGKPRLGIYNGSTETAVDAPDALPMETWTHIAVTLEGTTGKMYVNGVEVTENTGMNIPNDITRNNCYIGRSNWESDAYADAVFDELRIWSTARTESEILAYINRSLSGYENGLEAYYNFDTVSDAVFPDFMGNHDGTLYNGASQVISGLNLTDFSPVGNALSLDGDGDYVQLPAGVWFNGDFTVESWVYINNYNYWSRLIDFGNGPGSDNVLVALSNGETGMPAFGIRSDSTPSSVDPAYVLPKNQWTHIAVTLKGTIGTMYINGEAVAQSTSMNTPNDITRNFCYIGRSNWDIDADADAVFDEMRIWSTARSQTEIQDNMYSTVLDTESGLEAYFRFDQSDGDELIDLTGNDNDGTINGNPAWTTSGADIE